MAQIIPGLTLREIDQSQPTKRRPEGIPAGVIGTAQKGPAFVPVLFGTKNDFIKEFGTSDGGKFFGPIAVARWMENSKAGIYLRVLGVGNAQKASGSTGVTTNAGYEVGIKMRDKDRTTAGQVNGYPELENVDDPDLIVDNPYAGDAVPDVLSESVNTPSPLIAGAEEEGITIVVEDGADNDPASGHVGTELDDFDGFYILIQNKTDGFAHAFFLSSQAGRALDTAAGRVVMDGTYQVKDFSSIAGGVSGVNATVHIVDLSGTASANEVATEIASAIDGVGGLTCGAPAANSIAIDQDATGAGTFTRITGVNAVTTAEAYDRHDVVAVAQVPVSASTQVGVTADAGAAADFEIRVNNLYQGAIGSTIVLTGQKAAVKIGVELTDGSGLSELTNVPETGTYVGNDVANESYIEINVDGMAVNNGDDLMNAIQSGLTDAYNALGAQGQLGFKGDAANVTFSANVYQDPTLAHVDVDWDQPHAAATAGNVAPSLTIVDNSPSAPKGRVHFLGVNMYSKQADDLQDYLPEHQAANAVPVLRGVLFFPNGVVPGIATSGTTIDEATVPSVAWGEYSATKDLGGQNGHLTALGKFQLILNGYTGSKAKVYTADFDPKSSTYFKNVLNEDPEKIQEFGHYLYAHYDIPAGLATVRDDGAGSYVHCVPGAHDHNDTAFTAKSGVAQHEPTYENWRQKFSHASSPWIYSQKLGASPKKLFRLHSLDAGEASFANQFKIQISRVHQPSRSEYATFDLELRRLDDTDGSPIGVPGEAWRGLTLDPTSDNYIGRKIGDMNTYFDFEKDNAEKQKIVVEGLYPNQSSYVRVEMNPQVEAGQMDISALPVGFAGKNHLAIGKSSLEQTALNMVEPPLPFRQKISSGFGSNLSVDTNLCWGLETMYQSITSSGEYNASVEKNASLVYNLTKHFPSVGSYHTWVGDNAGAPNVDTDQVMDADLYNYNRFSLENIWSRCKKDSSGVRQLNLAFDNTYWKEALYLRDAIVNTSGTAPDGGTFTEGNGSTAKTAGNHYRYLNPAIDMVNPSEANLRFFKFVVPMQGGFDGLDIFDADKKAMNNISSVREMAPGDGVSQYGGLNGPTTAAYRKALDILAEKADVDIKLLAVPGMMSGGVTDYAIDKTEDRFDALYIMDIPAFDQDDKLFQDTENTYISVINTAKNLQDRNIDSSFAAAYFPEVNIRDPFDGVQYPYVPASCVVLGAMGYNDRISHPWYAPAGFNRGTLADVYNGKVEFGKEDLNTLHAVDINPITSFANSAYDGMVVWGQKTMLQGKSALDRVNVRRLLIDIRRKVRVVANSILFEPNRESTLAAFSAKVNPILGRIQQQQGLDRFKVVIDTTTTTQQDIENNTIRGKIFLQPTKSIEFISLDFVVGNQID